jgi:hypothetical protein
VDQLQELLVQQALVPVQVLVLELPLLELGQQVLEPVLPQLVLVVLE